MNRILFEEWEVKDGVAVFSDERAEHVLNVLHGEVGQILKTGIVNGLAGTSEITAIRNERMKEPGEAQRGSGLRDGTIEVRCHHTEETDAPWIDLILAPPRPRTLKRLLPQFATMGVGKIILVGAEKVEKAFWGAQLVREEVYRPLLVEGLMQSGMTTLPEIRIEKNFRKYAEGRMAEEFAGQTKIVAHPAGETTRMEDAGNGRKVIAIGPEGGWTDGEVEILTAKGFMLHSLGKRILRTDTAAIALIAQAMTGEER